MFEYGAASVYELAGGSGELLLMLLIAFGLGALFGRTILVQSNHRKERALSSALPPATHNLPPISSEDDLKKIPGIGPRVEDILREHGIRTFAQLSQLTPERLSSILKEAGTPAAGVRTWPMMAAFLAAQKVAQQ